MGDSRKYLWGGGGEKRFKIYEEKTPKKNFG